MARLIDVDALNAVLKKWMSDADVMCEFHTVNVIEDCIYEVDSMPTVDAAPVVHGEWSIIEYDYTGMTALECSVCNQEYWFEDEPPMKIYNYCPNCGAYMRDGYGNGT